MEACEIEARFAETDRPIWPSALNARGLTLRRDSHEPMQVTLHVEIETRHAGYVQRRFINLNVIDRIKVARALAIPEAISSGTVGAQSVPARG